jgi:hypothetical protein
MARKKISELTERTDFDVTCELPLHDAVQTWKTTAVKMLAYFRNAIEPSVQAKTANYVILVTDKLITMDATAGNRTLTLPTAVGYSGRPFILKKIDSSSNTVQLLTTSAQTIDGNASGALYLRLQWDTIKLVSNGFNWLIEGMNFGIAGGNFLISY